MKNFFVRFGLAAAMCLLSAGSLRADDALRRIQQSLRDQGFYYGPVDGSPGDETTQAIRRYQIRNGLGVNGQLNDETRQAIERTGAGAGAGAGPGQSTPVPAAARPRVTTVTPEAPRREVPAPAPASTPFPHPSVRPVPDPQVGPGRINEGDGAEGGDAPTPRGGDRGARRIEPPEARADPAEPGVIPRNGFAPSEALSDLLAGTPYEFAPPPVQGDVVRRAQTALRRDGYYDGPVTGTPGPHTRDALANFQRINRLPRTGRLDVPTLQAMRLMPERREGRRGGRDGVFQGRVVD